MIALFCRIGFLDWQVNRKTKEHVSMPAGPEAKESPSFFDLMVFFRSSNNFSLWFSADSRTQKLNSDKFEQWRIRRRMWRNMYQHRRSFSHKSLVYSIRVCVYNIRVAPLRTMPLHDARYAVLRSTVRINSHHASVRSDRAVLYLLRKTARLRCSSLAFASKIRSFQCFRPKRTFENFSPNQWVLLSFIFFLFLHFFRCFSGQNGSFVLQIVQFSRTWCSYHFVSYFEIQILHVSKFFNDFRGNRNLQKNEKKRKRGKKRSTNKATDEKRKTNAPFLFACQRHFVFFRTGTLVCCKFYGKRVVGLRGGLRAELRSHAGRKIL